MRISFILNDKPITADAASGRLLADIIYDLSDKKDTLVTDVSAAGCREGVCGRCLVLIDDEVHYSCLVPGFSIRGRRVSTFTWFTHTKRYEDIIRGFGEAGFAPCRLCFSGRVFSAESLLNRYTIPNDEQITDGFSAVSCTCSGFYPFMQGVKLAARFRRLRE